MSSDDTDAVDVEFVSQRCGESTDWRTELTFLDEETGEEIVVALEDGDARAVNRATLPAAMEDTLHAE